MWKIISTAKVVQCDESGDVGVLIDGKVHGIGGGGGDSEELFNALDVRVSSLEGAIIDTGFIDVNGYPASYQRRADGTCSLKFLIMADMVVLDDEYSSCYIGDIELPFCMCAGPITPKEVYGDFEFIDELMSGDIEFYMDTYHMDPDTADVEYGYGSTGSIYLQCYSEELRVRINEYLMEQGTITFDTTVVFNSDWLFYVGV